jgi:hypothetical protein
MAKTRVQEYREYLQKMRQFCLEREEKESEGKGYWKLNATVWKMADDALGTYFKKEDFEDES